MGIGLVLAAVAPAAADAAGDFDANFTGWDTVPGISTSPGIGSVHIHTTLFAGGYIDHVSVTNPQGSGKVIGRWHVSFKTAGDFTNVRVRPDDNAEDCGVYGGGPYYGGLVEVLCAKFREGGAAIPPGQTKTYRVISKFPLEPNSDDQPPSDAGVDVQCADALGFGYQRPVFAAKLDECDREALGTPKVWRAFRTGSGLRLTISGAPQYWATRLFGASKRRQLKTARSGKTLAKVAPSPHAYPPFGTGTVKAGRKIKFVREAWIKPGERPIMSGVVAVKK